MKYFSKSLPLMLLMLFVSFLINGQVNSRLTNTFKKYETVQLNSASIMTGIQSQRNDQKSIILNGWELTLFDSKIIAPHYSLRVATSDGVIEPKQTKALPMNGYTRQGGRASLTFNENYIYGFVEQNGTTFYIEPMYHFDQNAAKDFYVVYDQKDIIDTEKRECGTTHEHRLSHHHEPNIESERQVGTCKEVEYAIASDFLMFQDYGSVTAVENHAIGVTNNVQTNYDDEFADELKFVIVQQFVSNCSTCDPWTSSLNGQVLLADFADWADTGGFTSAHDLGSLWTDRDIFVPNVGSGVIGIAYLGAVCTSIGYNVLEDFSSNANLKRVMVAHEFGHNFDADHDAGGSQFIMAPSVQNTTQWSSASITAIQNYYNGANCLATCASTSAPNAEFSYSITEQCTPGKVQFADQSTGTISQWNWVFEGGTPATSTQQNPLVTYNTAGIYNVSLTVSSGSLNNTLALNDEIEILASPIANFSFSINGNFVDFSDLSTTSGATSYLWNFGDNSSSTNENPTHTYINDGTYTVTLIIQNDCGTSSFTDDVVIATPPTANFTANQTVGCAAHTVNYTSTSSSNTVSYNWVFQGGNPSTSAAANPIVNYSTPGTYTVSLSVSNGQGTNNKTLINFITVNASPVASYTYNQSGLTFSFANTSTNATSYIWDFGDGNTSVLLNPVHTYTTAGNYIVKLTADNPLCPENSTTQNLNATSAPISSFAASANSGCASLTTTFTSTSQNNPTSFAWTFPGGNPATSTLASPTVTYVSAGSYDVTLVTTNNNGSNTLNLPNYVQVTTVPNTNFVYTQNGLNYTFTNTSASALSYVWDFGDGNTSILENPSHTYAAQGNYTVKLISSNACGQTEKISPVTVLLAPVANANSSTGEICSSEAVTYTDLSTGTVTSRNWTFNGGSPATSTSATAQVSYATSGTYLVRLIVENNVGVDTLEFLKTVFIKPLPAAQFTYETTGASINLSSTSSASNSLLWTGPANNTYTTSNITYTPTINGDYLFVLTATNECGSNSNTQLIGFYNLPDANFTSNLEGLGLCAPVQVQYEAPKSNQSTFEWIFDGGTPPTSLVQSPLVTYTEGGSYNVQLIVTNPLGADTTQLISYVTLGSSPTANYTEKIQGGSASFEYTGVAASSYFWNFGGQGTSVLQNPSFTFTANGTYVVTCIATNSCGSDTISKTFTIIAVGTKETDFKQQFSVYPNPVLDYINIDASTINAAIYDAVIIDNIGKSVLHVNANEGSQRLNVQTIVPGLYTLMLRSKDKVATFRFYKM